MKLRYRQLIAITIVWILQICPLTAQNGVDIEVVEPQLLDDSLACSIAVPQLLSGNTRQTLLSGLPVLIEIQPSLIGTTLNHTLSFQKYRLTYDIWEDSFLLEGSTRKIHFTSLEQLALRWNPWETAPLFSLGDMQDGSSYQIRVLLRVLLLTRSQSQKINDLILHSDETEERLPTQDRNTGFRLNLNQVVSLFLSQSDIINSYETEKVSSSFRVKDLVDEKE